MNTQLVRRSKELLFILIWLAMIAALVLLVADFAAADDRADAAAAIAIAQAQASATVNPLIHVEPKRLTYTEAQAKAIATGQDLRVYVGLPSKPSDLPDVICEIASLEGYPAKCIVVARPANGAVYWLVTLGEDGQPLKAVTATASPFPDPFSPSNRRSSAERDDKHATVGLRFNGSHQCPTCGRTVTAISGRGPGGTHTHTCPRDGTTWYH